MNEKIQIGLLGIGTVGSGVLETILNHVDAIEIKRIAERDQNKIKQYPHLPQSIFTDNAEDLINDPDIKIFVELIGGINTALDLIKKAIMAKKHIVTANKELIAKHGKELFNLAEDNNVVIMYEAAVAGGIPIIMPLKQSLSGNKINKIAGILNGTTNYILTKMEHEGRSFEDVLKEAQKHGYAEADPTADVQGYDAAYKIAILASIAFNKNVDINSVHKEGIVTISPVDIGYANEFGYKIKLIGLVQNGDNENIDVRVHPMLVPHNHPISATEGVLNAIVIEGEPVSRVMFSGPGAGKFPTASSVVGDILCLAHEIKVADYPLPMMRLGKNRKDAKLKDINETVNKYYVRLTTFNKPGVIGELGTICGKNNINLHGIVQKEVINDENVVIVLLTENALEKNLQTAVSEMSKNTSIKEVNNIIRVME